MKCEQYDYVEIACMYRFPLLLVLLDGSKVRGIAKDIQWNEFHQECIVIDVENRPKLIPLDTILKMSTEVNNPYFKTVSFLAG